jgi:phosphatidate cytidylyltransferase
MKRLITAVIFIPLFYLYVMKLPGGYFFGLLSVVALLGLYEFYRMFRLNTGLTVLSISGGLLFLYLSYRGLLAGEGNRSGDFLNLLSLFFIALVLFRAFIRKEPRDALRDTGISLTGLVYVVLLITYQLRLRELGPHWIIYLYGVIWISDSSAYYVGSTIGKRRLYPSLSPKKTVEGAIGSLIGGGIGSVILGKALDIERAGLLLGIIIGGLCVVGDLIESMFKRDAGVKDSSNLIPGHGGVLDKIDSALFVAPFLYWYLMRA